MGSMAPPRSGILEKIQELGTAAAAFSHGPMGLPWLMKNTRGLNHGLPQKKRGLPWFSPEKQEVKKGFTMVYHIKNNR